MNNPRSHAELITLRKRAEDIALARKERMTSVHLLAAVAASEGPGAEVLRDRHLDEETLLKASRSFDDDGPDPIVRVLASARQLAGRAFDGALRDGARGTGGTRDSPSSPRPAEPSGVHLLLALLADRASAAHRALLHAGVDLAKLRAAAMQAALGMAAARRGPARGPGPAPALSTPGSTAAKRPRGGVASVASVAQGVTEVATKARPMTAVRAATSPRPAALQPGVAVPFFPPPGARTKSVPPAPAQLPATPAEPRALSSAGAVKMAAPRSAARFALDKAAFPVLASIGHNLTLAAAEGSLDPTVGRDAEIDQILDVLAKRHANSACLIGPPGVGKTAVARGLAQRFAVPSTLTEEPAPRVLVELVVSELCAAAGTRAGLSDKLAAIRAEVATADGRVVLFIDEVHELFAIDEAMAEIKLGLTRGELRVVAATSPEELRRAVEADTGLARRLTVVEVEEPCEADAFLLLESVAAALGRHHGLTYTDEAIAASIAWSIRYLPGRALPDKAISILDLAGARARRKLPPSALATVKIGPPEVACVVSELADLPVERLLETDRERMLALEELLAERVVGHAPAISRIARVLRRNAAGLRGRRPIGTFLLLGPTGVGKTETAKAIAEALFHSPDAMTRLDFSEYAEAHAVARLIGAPPGYVGYEAGGQLTEAVRRRPYQVILLDEIEKAHRDVLEAFLQVFDEGRLTDGRGRRVDFTNTVIAMTSNLGATEARALTATRSVGFSRTGGTGPTTEKLAETMLAAARAHLPPELYNRIDEVLCFAPLTRAEVAEIARRLLTGLADGLLARGVQLDVDPAVIDALMAAGGFDAELGARPMKRTIARLIENPLADLILRGDLEEGSTALVEVEGGEVVVDAVAAEPESGVTGRAGGPEQRAAAS